jgi:hypothetical protein
MDEPIRALRELLIRVSDSRAMTPSDVACFLGIFREISNPLFKTLSDNSSLAPHRLSDEEIRTIDGVFAELADNFFPMAHSNKPLGALQIVERESIARTIDFSNQLENVLSQTKRRSEEVRRDLERYPKQP